MAAADSKRIIRNAAYRFHFMMRTITDGQILSGDAGNLDAEVSLASASFADITASETEIGSTGVYYVDMTAAEMTADGSILIRVTSSTSNADELFVELQPEPALDSGVVSAGGTSTTILLRSAASSTDNIYNGAVIELVRGTGAGQSRTIVAYDGGTVTATVDRAWATNPSTDTVYIIHPITGSPQSTAGQVDSNVDAIADNETAATNLATLLKGGQISGSVNDASPNDTGFDGDSGLSSTDDFYNDSFLLFVSGSLLGLAREISDYDGGDRTFTFATAFPAAPANSDEFVIIGRGSA